MATLDGKVSYDLPEGTQTGTVFRLRGSGVPNINGRGRGDQYVKVTVEVPRNLTAEQKELKVQLKQAFTGGTDAAHIQRSLTGIRVLGLSLPTRYIHSASNVALYEDYEQTRDLVIAMLREWKLD